MSVTRSGIHAIRFIPGVAILAALVLLAGVAIFRLGDLRTAGPVGIALLAACTAGLVLVLAWARAPHPEGHGARESVSDVPEHGVLARGSGRLGDLGTLPALCAQVVAIVLVTALVVGAALRPHGVDRRSTQLWRALEAGDAPMLAGFFPEERRAFELDRLRALVEYQGWSTGGCDIGASSTQSDRDRVRTVFHVRPSESARAGTLSIGSGPVEKEVVAEWVPDGRRWSLERLEIPPPAFDQAAQGFADAWARGDVEALAGYAAPAKRPDLVARIRELLSADRVLGTQTTVDYRTARVRLETEREAIQADWTLSGRAEWVLASVERIPR